MPSSLGPAEILVILVVALIVLGPQKLPQAGRQVGKALSEVRRWSQEVKSEVSSAFDTEPPMASQPPSVSAEVANVEAAKVEAANVDAANAEAAPQPASPAETRPPAADPEAPVDDRA